MVISSVSAEEIGPKSTEVSNATRDESTDRSAATSAGVLNPTQTAPQTPFITEPVDGLTDEKRSSRKKN
ncbi:MAG: hypothetical protein LBI69_05080 [Puniceicoccales bacterium]|jgi:hypothetical protein|nr:hypothetical protein [Puniceicoccales bacterium]